MNYRMTMVILVAIMVMGMSGVGHAACSFGWDAVTKYLDGTAIGTDPVVYKVYRKATDNAVRTACMVTNVATCVDAVCDPGDYYAVAVSMFGVESAKSNVLHNKQLSAVINLRAFFQ